MHCPHPDMKAGRIHNFQKALEGGAVRSIRKRGIKMKVKIFVMAILMIGLFTSFSLACWEQDKVAGKEDATMVIVIPVENWADNRKRIVAQVWAILSVHDTAVVELWGEDHPFQGILITHGWAYYMARHEGLIK